MNDRDHFGCHTTAFGALRGWLAVLLLCVAGGCSAPSQLGGGDGIGGSGIYRASLDGDAGGDGIGGTGIVGAITGFGSVQVNGLEIALGEQTRFSVDAQPATAADLRVGQVVEILARGPLTNLQAQEVSVLHALAGPVEAADADTIQILGQRVRIGPTTTLAAGAAADPGRWLRVSGFRDAAATLHATRIDAGRAGLYILSGIPRLAPDGSLALGGQTLVDPGRDLGRLADQPVWVSAAGSDAGLRVQALRLRAANPFADRARRLVVQGFAQLLAQPGRIRLNDLVMEIEVDAAANLVREQPVVIDAVTDIRDRIVVQELDVARPSSLDSTIRLVEPRPGVDPRPPVDTVRPARPDTDLRPVDPPRPTRPQRPPVPEVRPTPIRDLAPRPEIDLDSRLAPR